ncbi:MAG: hypothetical protein M1833_007318 [Piccolia ochrophora]|nr:MAG: hypothetical protein M1833_007318 [Piccolia ochrophora]
MEGVDPPELGDLCVVTGQRSQTIFLHESAGILTLSKAALLGNNLYFIGGEYTTTADGDNPTKAPSMYWIELDSSLQADAHIPADRVMSSQTPLDLTPRTRQQVLRSKDLPFLYENTTLYLYNGWRDQDMAADNVLPAYNVSSKTWSASTISGGNFQFGNRGGGLSVSVPATGQAFFLGGDFNLAVPGMVRVDLSDASDPSWTNETKGNGSQGDPVPNILAGEMVYLPVGEAGALVTFGGYDKSLPKNIFWKDIPMNQISLYDVASSTWYQVNATGVDGNIPSHRAEFCAAVSRAPDDSSFQVTMYGGYQLATQGFEEVWVLSIPSFQWIFVSTTSDDKTSKEEQSPITGRAHHRCTMWKESQMVVLGGHEMVEGGDIKNKSCTDHIPPIRVLDTSSYTWKSHFMKKSSYTVPPVVSKVIGGDSSGKATKTAPNDGFLDPKLEEIFSKTLPRIDTPVLEPSRRNQTNTSSELSPTASATVRPARHLKSTAVLVGIILGCSLGTALTGLGIVIFWRRSRRLRAAQLAQADMKGGMPPELGTRATAHHLSDERPELADGSYKPEIYQLADDRPEMPASTPMSTRGDLREHYVGPVELPVDYDENNRF